VLPNPQDRELTEDEAPALPGISDLDGDGLGYDVKSFEPDGKERLLEIKTTCGHQRTAFNQTGDRHRCGEQRDLSDSSSVPLP
jgi:hypothetical protein